MPLEFELRKLVHGLALLRDQTDMLRYYTQDKEYLPDDEVDLLEQVRSIEDGLEDMKEEVAHVAVKLMKHIDAHQGWMGD